MSDLYWTAAFEYVRMKAAPLIATAVIFIVFTAVTAVLVAKSLRERDGGGDS